MSKSKAKHSATIEYLRKKGMGTMVRILGESKIGAVPVSSVRVSDGYDTLRYGLERRIFYYGAATMNLFLAKRPDLPFGHRRNLVRHTLYRLPSFAKWAELMNSQGSLAMEPLHNPEVRRLANGGKLGPITRRLFRHGSDPVGIRSRTVLAGWLAFHYIGLHPAKPITWLSLAGGSAVHAMFMVDASGVDKTLLTYANVDINSTAIELAKEVTALAGLQPVRTHLRTGDVFDTKLLDTLHCSSDIDIVDMLGILEYLDDRDAARLIKLAYGRLKAGGIILTCNMRPSHPQLDLHKRGVGWPGVIPRTEQQLLDICEAAGVPSGAIAIYQPTDGVYNIIRIQKG